ncbi:hypothetical protein BH10BAC2_BH10BAC2_49400 [soil metagenome]
MQMIRLQGLIESMLKINFILLFLWPVQSSYAQKKDSLQNVHCFVKKNYIQPYIGTFKRSINLLSNQHCEEMNNLRFSPNSSAFAGISLNYKRLNIYLETAMPNTHKVDRSNSDVRSTALFVHHFQKKWGVTGFVSWNKGLLMFMPSQGMYGDRNDLRMITAGTHIYNIFNGEKFSYSAANSMTKQQTKSKGSLLLMTTPMYRKLYSSESIIPDSVRPVHLNGTSAPSKSLQFFSLQCKPGYTYNFIFKEGRYFIAPAVYAGAGIDYHTFKAAEELYGGINFNTGYRVKFVTGINCEKFYLTLEYLRDKSIGYLYKTDIENTYTELSCNLGIRF